jgi:hypothetical protein
MAGSPSLGLFIRLNRDSQAHGLELIDIKLGSFLVGDQQKGHATLMRFQHPGEGRFAIKRGELDDGTNDKKLFVLVIVMKKDFPWRKLSRRSLGWSRLFLSSLLGRRYCCIRSIRSCRCVVLCPLVRHFYSSLYNKTYEQLGN